MREQRRDTGSLETLVWHCGMEFSHAGYLRVAISGCCLNDSGSAAWLPSSAHHSAYSVENGRKIAMRFPGLKLPSAPTQATSQSPRLFALLTPPWACRVGEPRSHPRPSARPLAFDSPASSTRACLHTALRTAPYPTGTPPTR
jgi:hypothetical protein